jgi:integrase
MAGRCDLPRIGAVVAGPSAGLPYLVVDTAGGEVEPVSRYLRDRVLGDVSPLTCRSYAHDLLRWFRLLWVLKVPWDRVTEAETEVLAGWLRHAANPQRRRRRPGAPEAGAVNVVTGKPEPGPGNAPSAITHTLTVVSGFYAFHLHFGRGPVANPVPENSSRRKALAHRSPLQEAPPYRRARLRPRQASRVVRSIPDGLFDDLFACMGCDRDRALLAFYVSSGARASELLGLGWTTSTGPGRRSTSSPRGRGAASRSRPQRTRSSSWPATSIRQAARRPGPRSGGRCGGRRARCPTGRCARCWNAPTSTWGPTGRCTTSVTPRRRALKGAELHPMQHSASGVRTAP